MILANHNTTNSGHQDKIAHEERVEVRHVRDKIHDDGGENEEENRVSILTPTELKALAHTIQYGKQDAKAKSSRW